MIVLAALKALLHRHTGQDDIVIGAPVAARTRRVRPRRRHAPPGTDPAQRRSHAAEGPYALPFPLAPTPLRPPATDRSSPPSLAIACAIRQLSAGLGSHRHLEVPDIAYTIEDFKRDTLRLRIAHLHELDPEDIQAIVDQFPIEARLRGLDSKERLRGLDPEERLRGLDPAIVEEWLKRRGH